MGTPSSRKIQMTLSFELSACKPEDSELFFSYDSKDIAKAKSICAECPIKRQCLESALDNQELFGTWGGVSYMELRQTRSVDINNEYKEYSSQIRCPWCGPHSTKYLEVVKKRQDRTQIRCSKCDLTWVAKKSISKKKRNF